MKDIHTHLLFGIDDGSKTIDESIVLLNKMSEAGIKELVLTPHYIENSKYMCNNADKRKLLTKLKNRLKKEKIDISLYLGNEVFFTSNFIELLDKKEISTINKSRYILFEFPMSYIYNNTTEVLMDVIRRGYIPILAHPERYRMFLEHPMLIEKYIKMGVLLQGNYTSLFGKYGRKCKRLLKLYIKKGWISFLGSDTHHDFKYDMNKLNKMLKRINKNQDYINDILDNNFDRVINDEAIPMIRID